ncbi:MAG: aldo/keto reductase [Holophagaceae bacterium]|nr:aldo/keto reductase [Holophagaceae bacterium]
MTFGQDWGWGADATTSEAMLERYLGAGGNFLDTANIYTKGHSEVIIGDYFKQRGGRERVVLATKFCGNLHSGDPNAGGASRKSIAFNLEESLRRLKTDFIDLYWMHFADPHTPIDETMRALDDAVRAGKVRYIGISDTPAWKVVQGQYEAIFRNWTPFIALQVEYSLMERSVEGDLLPMAQEMGLGVTPWSPLKGGLLSGKYGRHRHPESEGRHKPDSKYLIERTYQILDALDAVAMEQSEDAAAVALAWCRAKAGVASPILGARTLEQLDSNLSALRLELTADQMSRLDAASETAQVFPHSFLANTKHVMQGGTSINKINSEIWPLAPKVNRERW